MAEDLLERIRRELHDRKEAARSAYEESQRLEAVLAALDSGEGAAETAPPQPRRQPTRRPAAPAAPPRAPRGENRRRILEVVDERAGVSAGEVAQVTGIARATVASTLAKLAGDGEIERVSRPAGGVGFKMASGAAATQAPAHPPAPDDDESDTSDGTETSRAPNR